MSNIGKEVRDDDSSGRAEKNLILKQCAMRTVIAVIIFAASQFGWWLGLTLLVILTLIVVVDLLPTLFTLIVEAIVGIVVYARIRRGIDVQNLKRLDGKGLEMDLVEIGKMNLYIVGKDIYSITLVSMLAFFICLKG